MTARQWDLSTDIPEGVVAHDTAGIPFTRKDGVLEVNLGNGWELAEPDTLVLADIIGSPFTEVLS